MMKQGFSCLHFTVIPFCLLGFIFLIVGLVSNNWMSVSKCSFNVGGTITEYSLKYTNGLWNKCNGDECTNIMDGPPEQLKIDGFCSGKGNDWYMTDAAYKCQSYKKCVNGVAKESGTCGSSSYFDLKSRTCVSSNPSCSKCHDWQCRGKTSNKNWQVKDGNCKTYWKCEANTDGELKYSEKTVANTNTEWYNAATQKEVTVKPAGCWDKECVVAGKGVTKVVVTDGAVCEKYYTCTSGIKSAAKTCATEQTVILTGAGAGTCLTVATYTSQNAADRKVCQNPKCKVANAAGKGDYTNSNQAVDCTSYYQCSTSKLLTTGSCSATTYFIKSGIGSCGSTKPAACKHYNCRTRADAYWATDGTTCKAYARCYNSGKDYQAGTCATGTLDATVAATVTTTATICTTAQKSSCKDPKCAGKSAGVHVTDGKTCKKYITCGTGETLVADTKTCSGTNVNFNSLCGGTTTSGSTTCYDPRCTALDATHSKTIYKYTTPAASNQDCSSYYRCSSGHYTSLTCASGTYFDDVSKTCTSTRPTKCRDPLCYGKADGNWRTDKADKKCISYYVCTSQVATKTGQSCQTPTGQSTYLLTNGYGGSAGTCVDPKVTTVSDVNCRTPTTVPPPTNPVNGGWSPWTLWSNCNVNRTNDAKTQAGLSLRKRTCTCPAPKNGGSGCSGDSQELTVCYTCAPEIGFIGSGRMGVIIAVICSILCCAWAVCLNVTKQCYAAHTIIFHSLVAALSGIIGAALFNGGKPAIPNCTMEGGTGFILAIIGAVCHIIALIVAIVIVVKTRKARVGSGDCKTKCEKQETKMEDRDHCADNPASEEA